MTDTVDIKWVDGTFRTVEESRLVQTRGGGVYKAKYLFDTYMNEYWDGVALLTQDENPPEAKPKGIDPESLKEWTLCEIENSSGRVTYEEVKGGNVRRGSGYSQNRLGKWDTVLRTIHRPSPGMNMFIGLDDGRIVEGCVESVERDVEYNNYGVQNFGFGETMRSGGVTNFTLKAYLKANPVDGTYSKIVNPKG